MPPRTTPCAALALSAALLLAGCGENEKPGLCPAPEDGSVVVFFNLFTRNAEELAPFPTDLKTLPADASPTGLMLDYERSAFASALNTLDGFGLYGGMLLPVSGPVDAASLLGAVPGGAGAVFLLDLNGIDGSDARTLEERLVPLEAAAVADDTALLLYGTTRHAVGLRPLEPLEPGTRYGLAVTSCALDAQGRPLGADEKFKRLLDEGSEDTQNPAAVDRLNEFAHYLKDRGYEKNDFAVLTTFTTMTLTGDMSAARSIIYEAPPPVPEIVDVYDAVDADGNLNPELLERMPEVSEELADWPLHLYRFDRMGKVVFGRFTAASFTGGDGLFLRDPAAGLPARAGDEELEFILVLPRPDPAAGIEPPYHLLLYQHAMGVCKETVLAVGDALAARGIAVMGIDAVAHGSRSAAGPGTCTIDAMEFFDLANFAVTGDRFRQTALDVMSLVRMVREGGDIDVLPYPGGDGAADLDASRLAFAGQSMGASVGVLFLAYEEHVGAGALNVAGGVLSTMMLHSTYGEPCELSSFGDYNLHALSASSAVQTIADKADPLNFAPLLLNRKLPEAERGLSILYQQATCDGSIPVETYGMLAEAMGLPVVEPVLWDYPALERASTPLEGNLADGMTAGLFQFGPPAPHEVLLTCDEECVAHMQAVQVQLALFLKTWFQGGPGVIIDPWNPDEVGLYDGP
jgi:hypothetical protein